MATIWIAIGTPKSALQSLVINLNNIDALKIHIESNKNTSDVTLATSLIRIYSDIQTYPTNARLPTATPTKKFIAIDNSREWENKITIHAAICNILPTTDIHFRPYISLILGKIILPTTRPAKYNEPKIPNVFFGEHSISYYSTQFLRLDGASSTTL